MYNFLTFIYCYKLTISIISARKKAKLQEYNDKLARDRCEHLLSDEEINAEANKIVYGLNGYFEEDGYGNRSLYYIFVTDVIAFVAYVGSTRRELKDEDLGFMNFRGTATGYEDNMIATGYNVYKPVLTHDDKTPVKRSDCINKYGFKSNFVYVSKVSQNVNKIEDAVQTKLQNVLIGRRLWRHVAKGGTTHTPDGTYKVYLTWSFSEKVQELQVNKHNKLVKSYDYTR